MRLAEFVLTATPDGSGEVVVYFFGPAQGGNVDANLARWKDSSRIPTGRRRANRHPDSSGAFPLTLPITAGAIVEELGRGRRIPFAPVAADRGDRRNATRDLVYSDVRARGAGRGRTREFIRFVKGLK